MQQLFSTPNCLLSIHKCHHYTGNRNSEMSGDSRNSFHIVEMFQLTSSIQGRGGVHMAQVACLPLLPHLLLLLLQQLLVFLLQQSLPELGAAAAAAGLAPGWAALPMWAQVRAVSVFNCVLIFPCGQERMISLTLCANGVPQWWSKRLGLQNRGWIIFRWQGCMQRIVLCNTLQTNFKTDQQLKVCP